jgi:hypothetical protein
VLEASEILKLFKLSSKFQERPVNVHIHSMVLGASRFVSNLHLQNIYENFQLSESGGCAQLKDIDELPALQRIYTCSLLMQT